MSDVFRIDFYPKDWMIDTQRLSLEERGAYIQILAAIYKHQDAIDEDYSWLANLCNCSVRKIKALLVSLNEKKFLVISDGKITQKRAEKEIEILKNKRHNSPSNARKRAENSPKTSRKLPENGAVSNKNKGLSLPSQQSTVNSQYIPPIIPPYIDPEIWEKYLRHRDDVKAKSTDLAMSMVVKKLDAWKAKGHDPTEILETSMANGWKGLFEPKEMKGTANGKSIGKSQLNRAAGLRALQEIEDARKVPEGDGDALRLL